MKMQGVQMTWGEQLPAFCQCQGKAGWLPGSCYERRVLLTNHNSGNAEVRRPRKKMARVEGPGALIETAIGWRFVDSSSRKLKNSPGKTYPNHNCCVRPAHRAQDVEVATFPVAAKARPIRVWFQIRDVNPPLLLRTCEACQTQAYLQQL